MVETVAPKYSVTYDAAIVNIYHADRGQGLPKHEHSYSHLTMCHAGSCLIRKEGVEKIITKDDQPVNLLANGWHEIEALEDGTVFVNIFAEGKL
jgi:quercetin dioxygenase-like cupin family protein